MTDLNIIDNFATTETTDGMNPYRFRMVKCRVFGSSETGEHWYLCDYVFPLDWDTPKDHISDNELMYGQGLLSSLLSFDHQYENEFFFGFNKYVKILSVEKVIGYGDCKTGMVDIITEDNPVDLFLQLGHIDKTLLSKMN